jgi:hypothetical protein
MPRPVLSSLLAAALAGALAAPSGLAQAPPASAASATQAAGDTARADSLPALPHPPDVPRSLFLQPPAAAPYACAPLPGAYFERDPLLDPPQFPEPGFFAGVTVQAAAPHVFNSLANGVSVGSNAPDTLRIPVAGFDWTVVPRVEVGYRLPSGFGDFSFAYRGMASSGTAGVPGPDAPATLHSRVDLNALDFDYASREFTPWANWGMRWRLGTRLAFIYYDSSAQEPSGAAAAGTGVFEAGAFNSFVGVGPHIGLELDRCLGPAGLALVARTDVASLLGHQHQGVSVTSTAGTTDSGFIANGQDVVSLGGELGLRWWPPGGRGANFFAGYQYEYWWNVGRLSNFSTLSRGDLSIQGLTLRAQYNF